MTGQSWLVEGVGYIAEENCPFCGQSLEGLQLVRAYKAVFGASYKTLKADVAALRVEADDAFGDRAVGTLENAIEQNRSSVEFWRRYCTLDTSGLTSPVEVGARFRRLHEAIMALLDRKARAPLEVVRLDEAPAGVLDAYQESREALEAHNAAVRSANGIIEATRAQIGTADEKTLEEQLTKLRAIKRRQESQALGACATYIQLREEKDQIETAKSAVRAKLNAQTEKVVKPYEARLNEYLARFNAGFRIAQTKHVYAGGYQAASTYQIVINNTAIELGDGKTAAVKPRFATTLSAGDRSTLALAFFLAHLDHDPELAERIVVFDDPFTSQDSFRRQWTVQEIKRKGTASAQVIVLSHDAGFLRQIWDTCPPDQRAALQIVDQGDHGCKIVAVDLADACKGRAASELDDLIAYQAGGAAKARDVIKKIRMVLETYCRTAYQGQFTGDDNLGDIVGKVRTAGEQHPAWALHDRLDVINDYSAQHHHGEEPADGTSADQIGETELKGFVRDTLRIANNLQA
jgi:wobble nucleotide-excising tRNase